jgi:transcriptional regulator of aromatic amino acid metabolism
MVSHGICNKCKLNLEFKYGLTLEMFLDTLAVRILVVDGDGNIQMANRQALRMLDKTTRQVRHLKTGIVLECVYAKLPGGCGKTAHCAGCTIWNTVMGTLKTGTAVNRCPVNLQKGPSDNTTETDLLISTMKSGNYVLLKIAEIKHN